MANASMDYFQQSITFESPDGPVLVALPEIDDWILYMLQVCISYGSQIGASIIMLLALLLLGKPEKRSSAIMIINCLSLTFNIIRLVTAAVYFSGPFAEIYAHYTGDFSQATTSDTATSVASTVFNLLMHISVEMSLFLQVRVICITLRHIYQYVILGVSGMVALLSIAFRFVHVVENDKSIVQGIPSLKLEWYGRMNTIFLAVSITWFSAIFIGKLSFALHQRRKLGLGQFGPMQVLIIMAFQTLIVPAFFCIYQYWGPPALSSYALTACAIFLPLSSLWASASIANRTSTNRSDPASVNSSPAFLLRSYDSRKGSNAPSSPRDPSATIRSSGTLSPPAAGHDHFLRDLEKQGLHN